MENLLDNAGIAVSLLIATFFFELLVSFFFNLKIRKIAKGEWVSVAILGGLATLLFLFVAAFNTYVGVSNEKIWYVLVSPVFAALGNATSIFIVKSFETYKFTFKPFSAKKLTHAEILIEDEKARKKYLIKQEKEDLKILEKRRLKEEKKKT